MNRPLILIAIAALCLSCRNTAAQAETRPNMLVILVDDLGFSDIGCYGSEISTPNLDRLAKNGLRFTQFYNTAKCHSSRVSLLTGRWCLQAGSTKLTRATTIAEVLSNAGYFTAMTGKWHLDKQPTDFGFDRYFGHLSGACNYYTGDDTFRLNGEKWDVPETGFYTTVADTDYALDFLESARKTENPWFLYVAYNAPHAPLQPLESDYKRYLGKYEKGWDAVRSERMARQSATGLFGKPVEASPRPDSIPAWDRLSAEMQAWEGRRMAAYAGMIDRVDREIGRLITDLERHGELANTVIMFFSDNGACPYDRLSRGIDREPFEPDTHWSDSTGWAWARNAPFRYYKQNQFEGGIATPAIVHWPSGLKSKPGTFDHTPAHLVDVLPTLAEIAGAAIPEQWPGRELTPLAGVSLAPILSGRKLENRPPIHLLFGTDRGLRDGDWKLVSFRQQPWELYNIASDRTELHNLAKKSPKIVKRMNAKWYRMTSEVLEAPGRFRAPLLDTATEHVHPEWTVFDSPEASGERHLARKRGKARRRPGAGSKKKIRGRIETNLSVRGDTLVLQCAGTDSGLAFDRLPEMDDAGPYTLEFTIDSQATGKGEIYWTVKPGTKLPRGGHLIFSPSHGGQPEFMKLTIPEKKRLFALRFDPCSQPGEVIIEGLTLRDCSGDVLASWPQPE